MRKEVIVILLLILISAAVLLYTRKSNEGFAETVANKIQDRANPLAATVNPRLNPSADYGIPEQTDSPNDVDATYLRELNLAALNVPIEQRTDDSGISMTPRIVRLSPRLDNENSFLGIVKFCKEKMEKLAPGENPFLDAEFNKYCGVCMSGGTYITGEQFNDFENNKGVGVVVYNEDKRRALDKQDRNKYKYPRAIPSLDAAQCTGASMNNDDDAPVLAINASMYDDMLKRKMCKNGHMYLDKPGQDFSCGKCKVETSQPIWSYVKNSRSKVPGPNNPIYMDLYGLGNVNVKVRIDGQEIALKGDDGTPLGDQTLTGSEKKRFNLMRVMGNVKPRENDAVVVTLKSINGGVPVFGGFLRGEAPPNGTETMIELNKVLERSTTVGASTDPIIAEGQPIKTFTPFPETLQEIKVSFFIPFTLIAADWEVANPQIGFFDCKNNAYLTADKSEKAFKFTDQCSADEAEGNLSNYCLTSILAEQKCSSAGEWYKDPRSLAVRAGGETRAAVNAYINGLKADPSKLGEYERGCLGRDTRSKCDPYLNDPNNKNISPDCLREVYNNQLVENPRLAGGAGVVYKENFTDGGFFGGLRSFVGSFFGSSDGFADYPMNFQSLDRNTPQFCRPEGKLNPDKSDTLKNIATGPPYKGKTGIDAVKLYLQDTYIRAIDSSLDINTADPGMEGKGRKTSWENCFGIDLAAPKTVTVRNIPTAPSDLRLPSSGPFTCKTTRPLGNPVYVAGAAAEVDSRGNFGWAKGDWVRDAPPKGTGCYWIGSDPNYHIKVPDGKKSIFKFNFCNPYGFQINDAILVGATDNTGTIKINGNPIKDAQGNTLTITNVIPDGGLKVKIRGMNNSTTKVEENTIEVECTNDYGAHTIWLAIYAMIGGEKKYIMTTNENWVYV